MFAYCGNNPVVRADYDGFTGELTAGWTTTMWWLTFVDGFLPIGDAIYIAGTFVTAIVDFIDTIGVDNAVRVVAEVPNAVQNLVDQVSDAANNLPPDGPRFRSYTRSNFRYNLIQFTGQSGKGMQAHHVFPNKFSAEFEAIGINIHDPQFGSWVDKSHQTWSKAYNDAWKSFFMSVPSPSQSQVFDFARMLSQRYGLNIYF